MSEGASGSLARIGRLDNPGASGTFRVEPHRGHLPTRPGTAPGVFNRIPHWQTRMSTLTIEPRVGRGSDRGKWEGMLAAAWLASIPEGNPVIPVYRETVVGYGEKPEFSGARRVPRKAMRSSWSDPGQSRLELGHDIRRLAFVRGNGVFERFGPAIVHVGGRVGHAPERGCPPFVGDRGCLLAAAVGRGGGLSIIAGARGEVGAHVVEQEVRIEPPDRAEIGLVAIGATDRRELLGSVLDVGLRGRPRSARPGRAPGGLGG